MISTLELENSIDRLTVTREALVATSRRIAAAFKKALSAAGVEFHAVNDGLFTMGNGYRPLQLCLTWDCCGKVDCCISDSLGLIEKSRQEVMPSVTTLSDSELAQIAEVWAAHLARASKHVVFMNMYLPKAVEACDGYNDLSIAFRVVRAWDVTLSGYVLRIDTAFKDLSQ